MDPCPGCSGENALEKTEGDIKLLRMVAQVAQAPSLYIASSGGLRVLRKDEANAETA